MVRMRGSTRLRNLMRDEKIVVAPGAYDCITGQLIAQAGFSALYMSGAGTAAMLGYPDYGLATLNEFADNAGRLVEAAGIPVIADADTGFGNELNVVRTVREYESRGVAAIQIEDQTFPKKCGHLDGTEVVGAEHFISKIRAAVFARRDSDTLLIARTDARSALGFDEAVIRANCALEVGADIAFIEAPLTMEEVADIPRLVKGPCLFNLVRGGKSPLLSVDRLDALGFKIVITPGILLAEVVAVCESALDKLKHSRELPVPAADLRLTDLFRRFGTESWDLLRAKFSER